jgi:SAGA-associated factor 73
VMAALSHWKPQPFVPQPANVLPIKRQYQLARLREQLDNATSGGAVNIFKVVSKNGARLPELDGDDAPGEPDFGVGANQGSRRTSLAFGLQQPPSQTQRRPSQASRV